VLALPLYRLCRSLKKKEEEVYISAIPSNLKEISAHVGLKSKSKLVACRDTPDTKNCGA
jgi:hypothetical protein